LPASAKSISVFQTSVPDSKIVKIWASLEISLADASVLAKDFDMHLTDPSDSVRFPAPTPVPTWWPNERHFVDAQYKWLIEEPDFKPAFFAMSWDKGKGYIFYYGFSNLQGEIRARQGANR
jgi:hypothetical protein